VVSTKVSPALAILICLLFWAIGDQLGSCLSWGHDTWQLTEALVNYAGGFVRRGLTGWLIGLAADSTGIQANHIVVFAGFIFYLLLTVWLLRYSTRIFPPALILSCIVMGFPAYQDSIIRKDCMGILLLLGCLLIDRSRLQRPLAILIVNFLAGVAILSHETFGFYAFPALVFFMGRDRKSMTGCVLVRRCVTMLPAGLCFLLTAIYHGSPAVAKAVNDSWMPLWRIIDPRNPHLDAPAAAIRALGFTSEQGLSSGVALLTSGFYQPTAWAVLFVITFVLVILFTDRNPDRSSVLAMESKIRVAAILLAQFVLISPLFLLGNDYGRWLFFWVASSLVLHTLNCRVPRWLESLVARIFEKAKAGHIFGRLPVKDWYLLFFGVPVCWNVHELLAASPVSRHLQIIWSWF